MIKTSHRKLSPKQWETLEKHQFRPGKSGNSKGRPTRLSIAQEFTRCLGERINPHRLNSPNGLEKLVQRVILKAAKGNNKCLWFIIGLIDPLPDEPTQREQNRPTVENMGEFLENMSIEGLKESLEGKNNGS